MMEHSVVMQSVSQERGVTVVLGTRLTATEWTHAVQLVSVSSMPMQSAGTVYTVEYVYLI